MPLANTAYFAPRSMTKKKVLAALTPARRTDVEQM